MTIEYDIATRITRADQISTSAISATSELDEVFSDLGNIRSSVFIPRPIDTTLSPVTLSDIPVAPDESRISSAASALGKMPDEIAVINALKEEIDQALSVFDSTFTEVQERIRQILALAGQIVIPQATDFQFTEGDFREGNNLDATLKSIIESEIQKGGEGYSSETEDAIYDMGGERSEIVRQEAIDDALDNSAGFGFSMPQGHHIEAVRKINEQYRLDSEKRSSDTMLLQTKLSLENKWRALNAGITYNQIILAYFDAKAQRALEAAIAVLSLKLFAIKYRTDLVRQALETGKTANKAIMEKTSIIIERYSVELLKYRKQIEGLLALAKGYTDQYRVKGQVYGVEVSSATEKSMLDQAENKFALENQKLNILGFLTSAQAALSSFISTAELRLGAATNGAQVQKAIAMATLDSLGTIVNRIKTGEYTITDAG